MSAGILRVGGVGRVNFSQVKLHSVAHAVVFERKLVLEGPLPLSLEEDLVWLTANAGCHLCLE